MPDTLAFRGPSPNRLVVTTVATVACLALVAVWSQLSIGGPLLPHAFCIAGSQPLLILHVVSDGLITAAYMAIPLAMLHIVRKRKDVPFGWVVWFFGAFIIACGITHAMEILTLYVPVYWITGVMKAFTAAVSIVTAWTLFRLTPVALALPSGADLRQANAALRQAQSEITRTVGELRRTEHLLQSVLSTARDAVIVADQSLRPVIINDAALQLFRWSRQDAAAGLSALMADAPLAMAALWTPGTSGQVLQLELPNQDGSVHRTCVEATVSGFVEDGQRFVTIVGRDVTQRRLAEERLLQTNESLQQFAYVASHDLRTPLRTIGAMLELIQTDLRSSLSAMHQDLFRRVGRAVAHMNQLTTDLLAYASADAGPLQVEPLDLVEVIDAARELIGAPLAADALTVAPAAMPRILGDRTQLTGLFVNMFDNALKYRSQRPVRIAIDSRISGSFCRVAIADNGIGIAPAHRARIFEIFKRLHREDQIPGTGIGLAIAKRVVQRHGGAIEVEDTPGGGATFVILLPLAPTDRSLMP